ncbi:cytochrome c oxidase subunit 3 [Streptomyces sp. NPDC051776]|uniref:cytochrome c oxidase subunit 3 n=1 Tax=Streptomyces sp. NPDC051776 TaxID=3155414 RepID=UPI00342FC418
MSGAAPTSPGTEPAQNPASSGRKREILDRKPRTPHVPGEPELWIFILGDLAIFGVFFTLWSWNHAHQPELFTWGRGKVSLTLGLINTVVLLTSSAAVAVGLILARARGPREASQYLKVAAVLGGFFVAVKSVEYTKHIAGPPHSLGNDFFMYYFVFTGIHLIHVLVGIIGLTWAFRRCRRPQRGRSEIPFLEGVAVYWHMVDLLWIVLFLLIYLI